MITESPPYGQRASATGDLHLTYITSNGRKVQALQLLGSDSDCPRLFEPRLVALSTNVMRFVGFERAGGDPVHPEEKAAAAAFFPGFPPARE